MQNSGLSNALNPLISIAHKNVYSIPLILIIGWRGSPRIKDEPQHIKHGEIQETFLKTIDVPYEIIDNKFVDYTLISNLINKSKKESRPVALIIKKNTFSNFKIK